jgi:hypothetical protein
VIYVTTPKVPVAAYQKRPRQINLLRYGRDHAIIIIIIIVIIIINILIIVSSSFFFFFFFYGVTAKYRTLASCSSGFNICDVLRREISTPRPTPNLDDKVFLL